MGVSSTSVFFALVVLFFLPGQSGFMHSSVVPKLSMGALHMVHDLFAGVMVPLGLRGYVCVQLGQLEHPANLLPALENIILI